MARSLQTTAKARAAQQITGNRQGRCLRLLLRRAIGHLVLIGIAAILLIPFYWMLITSFKPPIEALVFPPQWWPSSWHPENYARSLQLMNFATAARNTALITGVAMVGTLVSSSLCGFSFARLRWPGRNVLFLVVLATMMLPYQVTMIPLFVLFKELGWINTFLPLMVPPWFGGGAFNIFLTRQFVLTLPQDLFDAARIDGASTFRIWLQIVLPLTKPVLATIAIFEFIQNWHSFLGPLIYLNSESKFTIELQLRKLSIVNPEGGVPQTSFQMAGALVAMIPVLIIFFVGQRYFIRGIVMTGSKS